MATSRVLKPGELHHQRHFGPETVNRGAVLLECSWDDGDFEAGAMVSGAFLGGTFAGGTFLGGTFVDGRWLGGHWLRGTDRRGRYRHRTDHPPHDDRLPVFPPGGDRRGRLPDNRATSGGPLVTVFTSTVFPDLIRLWLAAVRRAFPPEQAAVEIFWDSDRPPPEPRLLPGAAIVRRGPHRRDYYEAYNDAIARCTTPYLAFVDSDVLWLDPALWRGLAERLAADPELAAAALMRRAGRPSHGTFAVAVRPAIYRRVLAERLPGGFCPAVAIDPALPWQRWQHRCAGDLAAEAVAAAGYRLELGGVVPPPGVARFDGVTVPRQVAGLLRSSGDGDRADGMGCRQLGRIGYHWRGLAANLVLARLHDRLFPDGPRYDLPLAAGALLRSPAALEGRGAGRRAAVEGKRLRQLAALLLRGRRTAAALAAAPAAAAAKQTRRRGSAAAVASGRPA